MRARTVARGAPQGGAARSADRLAGAGDGRGRRRRGRVSCRRMRDGDGKRRDRDRGRRRRAVRLSGGCANLGRGDRHAGLVPASNSPRAGALERSEEHTSELQSLMRISYAVFCLKKKKIATKISTNE